MAYSGPDRRKAPETEEVALQRFAEALQRRYFEEVVKDDVPQPLRRIEDAALPAHVQGLAERLYDLLKTYLDNNYDTLRKKFLIGENLSKQEGLSWEEDPALTGIERLRDTEWLIQQLDGDALRVLPEGDAGAIKLLELLQSLSRNELSRAAEAFFAESGARSVSIAELLERLGKPLFTFLETGVVDEFLCSRDVWEIREALHAWKRRLRVRVDDLLASGLLSADRVPKFEQLMANGGPPCFFENVEGLLRRVARGRALILAVEHGVTLNEGLQRELTQLVLAFSRDDLVNVDDLNRFSQLLNIEDPNIARGVAQALHESNRGTGLGPMPFFTALEREYRAPPRFITGGVKWYQLGEPDTPQGSIIDYDAVADVLENLEEKPAKDTGPKYN